GPMPLHRASRSQVAALRTFAACEVESTAPDAGNMGGGCGYAGGGAGCSSWKQAPASSAAPTTSPMAERWMVIGSRFERASARPGRNAQRLLRGRTPHRARRRFCGAHLRYFRGFARARHLHEPRSMPACHSGVPVLECACSLSKDYHRTVDELRQSEARYRNILETASVGVWTLSTDGTTTFMNRLMASMLGHEPAALIGERACSLLADGSCKMLWDQLQSSFDSSRRVE